MTYRTTDMIPGTALFVFSTKGRKDESTKDGEIVIARDGRRVSFSYVFVLSSYRAFVAPLPETAFSQPAPRGCDRFAITVSWMQDASHARIQISLGSDSPRMEMRRVSPMCCILVALVQKGLLSFRNTHSSPGCRVDGGRKVVSDCGSKLGKPREVE